MALRATAQGAAGAAVAAIGRGYDVVSDVRLKYCKGGRLADPDAARLIDLSSDEVQDVLFPGGSGIRVAAVPKSIKCDKGEGTQFRSDVLSFEQMSEQFNRELSLTGKIPSGMFNSMFDFSGRWQIDAVNTKSLAFDGWYISLYSVALSKSRIILRDHVIQAVPSTWDPAALARFIDRFGTHIVVGVKMGGKDVIYLKQQHSSSLEPAAVQKRLKDMSDRRFLDANGHYDMMSNKDANGKDKHDARDQWLRFVESSPSSSYCTKEDLVMVVKRRGGKEWDKDMPHSEWINTVQSEPDVISMSFLPITSLLNGVPGCGFLNRAIDLYLRYKPPIEELYQFLEFQVQRQWAPVYSDHPLSPQRKQICSSFPISFMGPRLYVYTNMVVVRERPVTGIRLYLEGHKSNMLAIHLQHLCSLPQFLQLQDDPYNHQTSEPYNPFYLEPFGSWNSFCHVYTAPVESDDDSSIVTGAQLRVNSHGLKKVLFLCLNFSKVSNAALVKNPEWEGSPNLGQKSGLISTLISTHFSTAAQKPVPCPADVNINSADVNINSAVYPGGLPAPVQAPKLLKYVDTTEMMRGPQDLPGYWVVSGAKLHVERGKITLRVKYSLLTAMVPDDEYPDHPKLSVTRSGLYADDEIHPLVLHGSQVAPVTMPLELLKKITNNFSEEKELGSGTFGKVYEGEQNGKKIAVKLLHPTQRDCEEEFMKEFENLRGLKHPNIVQLLGYCYEIKREYVQYKGMSVLADKIYRALCFEFMDNGSLQGHLDDESHGLDWQTRYKIIKGICEGLKYLHEGLVHPMYHLDLKPGNILLGKNMVPKLADFGLSKHVYDNQTQCTASFYGTIRYCPPEHIERNYVSDKFDIFSLGVVMIEIIAGPEGYRKAAEMPSQEFIDHVQENWRKRLDATPDCASPIHECCQVKRCVEIALNCILRDRKQRPNIGDIISWLNETENNTDMLAMTSTSQNERR